MTAADTAIAATSPARSEEHTSELQSLRHLVCPKDVNSFPTRRSSDLDEIESRRDRRRSTTTSRSRCKSKEVATREANGARWHIGPSIECNCWRQKRSR